MRGILIFLLSLLLVTTVFADEVYIEDTLGSLGLPDYGIKTYKINDKEYKLELIGCIDDCAIKINGKSTGALKINDKYPLDD
ncbi:hypothetical protein J4457_04270 [Candidatus Woesearchaeota archaeon]|nr:hypothetical protein [Candidatus Woesearchaeota archaeon]